MTINIKEINETVIVDGAMGTYYASLPQSIEPICEMANLSQPETIKNIHQAYIAAGAKLIRTNTFGANTYALNCSIEIIKDIVQRGCDIAKEVAKPDVGVGLSIGPIVNMTDKGSITNQEEIISEYKAIVDVALKADIDIFVFETFASLNDIKAVLGYIKEKQPNATVITQFTLTADGKTRTGIDAKAIVQEAEKIKDIDIYGFNCGVGPAHLLKIVKQLPTRTKPLIMLPNAGYPAVINQRTVYQDNPTYFGSIMQEAKDMGIELIGGCCGTTPDHIKAIIETPTKRSKKIAAIPANKVCSVTHLDTKPVYVELSPPSNTQMKKLVAGASVLKEAGAAMVTVPDSPMGKMRANSMIVASKIQREAGIMAMPHLTCRDKNIIGIKGEVLAGHIEDIRHILCITGDPIPEASRGIVKNVYNMNAFQCMQLIQDMNDDLFDNNPVSICGALNLNVNKPEIEIKRMTKKIECGATAFLTQPLFEDSAIEQLAKIQKPKNVKIFGGLMPVVTYRNAMFINNELPGIHIPEQYVDKFTPTMPRDEAEHVGIQIITEIAEKIRPFVDGFYLITPFQRYNMMKNIIKLIK